MTAHSPIIAAPAFGSREWLRREIEISECCSEAIRRARRILDRCYPYIPSQNPFLVPGAEAWLFSRERGDYAVLRRTKAKEIETRLLAKIMARAPAFGGEG